ncbi:CKLF-like MARVEL transmembrane domain-containing protein 4 [Culicoides brevitarsis]|uniref:CKLF-like MARVEL transmembrane domain-containing protein 4 n=1 Tax=Culicoides brevitarsis TaxID=469753 RepID=UPI00307C94AE
MMKETVVTVPPTAAHQQQAPGEGLAWLQFNLQYFATIPGIIKLVQLVFGIICMACASPALLSATHWFLFVAVTSFIATILWSFIYLLGIREVLQLPVNWILTELLNTGIATVFYFIAFIVQLSAWSSVRSAYKGSNITAGVFGLFNFLAYLAGTYFLYIEHKSATP